MKKIRLFLWVLGTAVVFAVAFTAPQYVKDTAQAVLLIIGENQCSCAS